MLNGSFTNHYTLDVMKLFSSCRAQQPDKHKYVSLIEFALRNHTFSVEEAMSACGFTEKEFRFVSSSLFSLSAYQADPGFDPARKLEWILKPEIYFSYLQYLEFLHAVRTARQAFWLSLAAIVIAIITTILALL